MKALNERYTQRITVAKQGQHAASEGDVRNAIKYYNMYLKILADVKEVADINGLTPAHFNQEKELSELLLISHIYWDLCKMFDVSPHLETEFKRSLNKFVEFTLGFKFQVVNAEMLRKFIRRDRHVHKKEFKEAYRQIFISSKKCYIATFCYGDLHPVTQDLRRLRYHLTHYRAGRIFIHFYYRYSPRLIRYCACHKYISFFSIHCLFKPFLWFISKLVP